MISKLFSFSRSILIGATGLALATMPAAAFAQVVPSATTVAATDITETDATLNGLNGDVDATAHSFWVSTSTFSTAVPIMPDGVYSTPVLPGSAATTTFSALLSSVTTDGVPSNMPAVTPDTTYYFAAWSEVDGTWYPGEVLNFTTLATPGPVAHPDTYVDAASGSDSNDCLTTTTACETIDAAIALVDESGTVHVAAGTYPELVTIDKSLTLLGAQAGNDARTRTVSTSTESVIDGTGLGGAVRVLGNEIVVTINGFTIENVSAGGADLNTGITTVGSTNLADLQVLNNVIQNVPIGIAPQGDGALIQYNLIRNTMDGPAGHTGIYTDFGLTNATIDSNTFVDNSNVAINLNTSGSDNTISNNIMDSEIFLDSQAGGTVTGNRITNSTAHGIQIAGGNSDITITGNIVHGSTDEWSAVRINGSSMNSNITISNNSLTGNDYGINITASVATNVTAHFNDLSGNHVSLYYGSSPSPLSATNNWWGCATSPATSTDEIAFPTSAATCGLITEDSPTGVTFDPWLASLNLTGNDPVSSAVHNSAGTAVGGNSGLEVSFSATGANPAGSATTSIGGDNTAAYDIDAIGPNSGDTTVTGDVLFAGQDSTLMSTLVINTPSSGGGGGGGGSSNGSSRRPNPVTQLVGCVPGSGDVFSIADGTRCPLSTPQQGQVLGASVFKFLFNLRYGMRNNDVMELQKRFRAEGFFSYPTDTGYFGPITFASAKAYQAAHPSIGYITGFVGPLTRGVLNQ
ncbi:MAG TPA: right-handed parallel beta-helix repeat-containing protein [Candidatus Paceibacterota bacterium]|nr:right-handed parallel beta-helix repeat-containing protein [Candidatus Paceibacterota bacterium]